MAPTKRHNVSDGMGGAISFLGLRGDRHSKNLWAELLPAAKKRLVDDGLFTEDGTITKKGRQLLVDKYNVY